MHNNQVCISGAATGNNLLSFKFCLNTGSKFREHYHEKHVIPHLGIYKAAVWYIPESAIQPQKVPEILIKGIQTAGNGYKVSSY